jgi:hypothetical protein
MLEKYVVGSKVFQHVAAQGSDFVGYWQFHEQF